MGRTPLLDIRSLGRFVITVLLFCTGLLVLVTCGGDSGTAPEGGDDPGEQPRTLAISLSASSGAPGEHVEVTGIPDDVEWAYARVTITSGARAGGPPGAAAQTGAGVALIQKTESGHELVVPLHPATPMQGGAVDIEVTNGTNITSNTVNLDVDALTPAPGAFDAAVTKLEALLDGWLAQQGTTAAALRALPTGDLSALEAPLLYFHGVINHPDNPNSLRAFADGDIPLLDGAEVDREVLDALTAQSRIADLIDDKSAFVDTLTAPLSLVALLGIGAGTGRMQSNCIEGPTFDIGPNNCEKLAEVMAYQSRLAFNKTSAVEKYTTDLADSFSSALGYVKGAVIGWGIVNTLWAADNIEAGSAGVYPSFFLSDETDFNIAPEIMPEDFSSPGRWSEFRVTAASTGWRFDDVLIQAFERAKGLKGDFDDKSIDGLVGGLADGDGFKDLKKYAQDGAKNAVYDKLKQEFGDNFEYCAQTWRGVDCTGLPYSEGNSPELTVDSANKTYEPKQVGTTTLEVKTTSAFGLITPTAETRNIETGLLEVIIDPFQASAGTSESVNFTVRVANAEDQTVEWYTEGPLPADLQPGPDAATVVTPADPWSPAIVLKARSLSNTGLRKDKANSDPREDSAPITYGDAQVIVTPVGECLKPGESLAFGAAVIGLENQNVTWSTEPPGVGSFNGDTYTAPNSKVGTVVIVATSVANPDAKGYASVRVAGCECWWTAVISGDQSYYWSGTNAVWGGIGFTGFTFETKVEGPGIHYPVITGSGNVDLTGGATGTWIMSGGLQPNDTDFWFPGDPDNTNAQPEITVTTNDGETIEGYATGPFFQIVAGDPISYRKVWLNLRFKATDSVKALCKD